MNVFKGTRQGLFCGMFALLALASFDASAARNAYRAITISGSGASTVTVGSAYSFQPSTSGGYSFRAFSIRNKPSWASFSSYTGKLSGTPRTAGSYSNIVITVTDGRSSAKLAAFTVSVKSATTPAPAPTPTPTPTPAPAPTPTPTPTPTPVPVNTAPTISGSAPAQVMVNSAYQFKAAGADADGDALTYSVSNLPGWASFNASTGTLSGTPTTAQAGNYSNIVISVSDGRGGSASLPAFAVNVVQAALGNATVSWAAPTLNTDGSALTNLSGYRVNYGTTRGGPYTRTVDISNTSITRHVVENLTPGTYYFAVVARTSAGVESAMSAEASKTIN